MERDKRIEELEQQVQELTAMVQDLAREKAAAAPTPDRPEVEEEPESDFVREVKERVERALGGGNAIEARIGAVWLGRLGVLVMMSALVYFARVTMTADDFEPLVKALIGFGVAGAFSAYGLFYRHRQDFFAEAIFGCGLATLYFTTYALFFVEEMRLFHQPWLAFPLMVGCLGLIGWAAHWRQSATVAGIGLFLAYYTVVLSAMAEPSVENLAYALVTATAVAAVTVGFHFAHRWMLFTWAALVSAHGTYAYFFLWRAPQVGLDPETYFWISNGFLTVCFVLFSFAAIINAWQTGEYRRKVAPMAGVNSFVFLVLTWFAVREHYIEYEWAFRTGVAVVFLFFAVLSHQLGPARNYLFQVFIAKTIIMATLALQAYLSGEILLVAMAIECLGLGFSYRRSGLVTFKALGLGLMAITFVASFFFLASESTVLVLVHEVPANWFTAVGVALSFCVVAWYYEHYVKRVKPEDRYLKGQWFLADTPLDLPSASFAIIHASAAAFLLLGITIIDLGDLPGLPFYLFGIGVALALLGLVLRTPQIDVASVLLLVAAHVAYHIFLWLPRDHFEAPFDAQPLFIPLTVLLSLFTFVGAYLWERYLRRFLKDKAEDIEHQAIASLPYLAATLLLTTLLSRELAPLYVPSATGGLAMGLLLLGAATRYTGLKISGLFALAMATYHWFDTGRAPVEAPYYLVYFGLFVMTFAGAERLYFLLQRNNGHAIRSEDHLRSVLVILAVFIGLAGLYEWSPDRQLIFWLLGYSVIAMALGAVFREPRYRWGALFLFLVVVLRAFMRLDEMTPLYQFLAFAAPGAVLLVVSWAYARNYKRSAGGQAGTAPGADGDG